jgi:hypothetical protein
MRGLQRRLDTERCRLLRDHRGQLERPIELLARFDHLLDEPDAMRLRGVVLLAGQQPPHRVAPAGVARKPDRRAAERVDAAPDLKLLKPRVRRGDADVRGQQQLDRQRHDPPLDGSDEGLGPDVVLAPRVTASGLVEVESPRADRRTHFEEIQAPREVITDAVEHTTPDVVVVLQLVVGGGQLVELLQVERVALRWTVEADQQHVAATLDEDSRLLLGFGRTGRIRQGKPPFSGTLRADHSII